jgi:ribosome-associated heat shock protein Hsp15
MATTACKTGKVTLGDEKIKPSYKIQEGDILGVKKNGFNLSFEVVKLISRRVSATLAAPCYHDLTPAEELNKYKDWFVGKAMPERRIRGAGRPTKKERREIQDFKINQFLEELDK